MAADLNQPPVSASVPSGLLAQNASWYQPPVAVTWQWQLSGKVNPAYDVEIYGIDLFDTSQQSIQQLQASGKKVICYFSGGSYEAWRSNSQQFSSADLGAPLDGWAQERWLDIRSPGVRGIMQNRLDLAQQKGCDGVEPDNMDGYTNDSGFDLTAADQLDFNRFIAAQAHSRALSVRLKNDLDQVSKLVDYFDFAVNEQCFEFDECEQLAPFIAAQKPVLSAEYKPAYVNHEAARRSLCANAVGKQFSTLILPLNLDDSFRLSC